jgi:hypothetical protein
MYIISIVMKKFFFTLFILLIIGGAGFFFGWVQFAVPPLSYGVIKSKTYGVDPTLVRSGEFRWVWFKLIPTNVKIAVFKLQPVRYNMNFNSSLPSGASYASFAGVGADFSWELRAVLSFSINPDRLVSLTIQHGLENQGDLDAYQQDIAKNIEVIIVRTLTSSQIDSQRLENILSGNQDIELEREIGRAHPEIQDFSFTIQSARFPDFILYRQVRLMYEEFLNKQREIVASGFGQRADHLIASRLRIEELERYGDLLTRFPILLEYLELESKLPSE